MKVENPLKHYMEYIINLDGKGQKWYLRILEGITEETTVRSALYEPLGDNKTKRREPSQKYNGGTKRT